MVRYHRTDRRLGWLDYPACRHELVYHSLDRTGNSDHPNVSGRRSVRPFRYYPSRHITWLPVHHAWTGAFYVLGQKSLPHRVSPTTPS